MSVTLLYTCNKKTTKLFLQLAEIDFKVGHPRANTKVFEDVPSLIDNLF